MHFLFSVVLPFCDWLLHRILPLPFFRKMLPVVRHQHSAFPWNLQRFTTLQDQETSQCNLKQILQTVFDRLN